MPTAEAASSAAAALTTHECDVLIIGAGFVGLAVGAGLASHGCTAAKDNMLIVEQGPDCGAFWRGGHEHLSLHSPHHQLPHDGGLAHEYPMFKTKHEVRDYVSRYAADKGLMKHISFGETVLSVQHEPGSDGERPWCVRTNKREHRARRVVVATGLNREPHVPAFEGADAYTGDLRHSWHVRDCRSYGGKRVLVVGSGNSAAELTVAQRGGDAGGARGAHERVADLVQPLRRVELDPAAAAVVVAEEAVHPAIASRRGEIRGGGWRGGVAQAVGRR